MIPLLSKTLFAIFLLLASAVIVSAQQKNRFPQDAVWIKMMADPNVNYYTAVKAYNDYWKTHQKPADMEDRLRDGNKNSQEEDKEHPLTKEEKRLQDRMVYEAKRFENWMREEKPFVQDDGRILNPKERKEIWEKQKQELEKQKKSSR